MTTKQQSKHPTNKDKPTKEGASQQDQQQAELSRKNLKGKKVDGDPSIETDQPLAVSDQHSKK